MEPDTERIERVVETAVRRDDERNRPAFYAVAGSHIYGFPSAGGDVDVRGFHLADGERYALLDEPADQVVVNQGAVTPGFEEYADVDLVSYELKKFGSLLYDANFNALEVVFDGIEVVNEVPSELDALKRLVEGELPLDVPRTYHGMAKTNYRKRLDPNRESYAPTAKNYLYALRGLLGARYVLDRRAITADVRELSTHALGDAELVDELVAAKRSDESAFVDDSLAERADEHIARLFDDIDPPRRVDKGAYREKLNDWMREVRADHRRIL
ncbi:nucleotidyltransferase domain-containing protein [Haladaptatus salinisoli]|uniref:nucleotidyltransferase domain-containing protein n=1 Tax=Haladaptatus salinisoli TaxID=2884876 RepID=UPI001D09D996|nr:nucleotidyltransferase domain-containing protein [Haladaptatus salinisoli]